MRLVEGDDRVPDARPERRAQARVGRFLHGRQPRHPDVARVRPPGRRHRAGDAGPGRGRRLGGAGLGVQRRQQRDHAQAHRPHDHVRQGRGGRREADPAGERGAQGPEGLEAHRQVGEAPRHAAEGDRGAGLRLRPEVPRDAQCRDQGLSGVRRQGEELRGRQGDGHARRPARGAGRRFRGRRRGRHVVAGEDRARRAAHRLGRGPERRGVERDDRRDAEGRPRCRSGLRAQPERRREGSHRGRGRRRSRRCTPIRSRTTRRWSR